MKKILLGSSILFLIPSIASAQTLFTVLVSVNNLIGATFPVLISLAILFFLWGLLKFFLNSDSPEARSNAKTHMMWGIITIFVMISIWGFVNFLGDIFVGDNTPPDAPVLNTTP